jgi:hypothetical protein
MPSLRLLLPSTLALALATPAGCGAMTAISSSGLSSDGGAEGAQAGSADSGVTLSTAATLACGHYFQATFLRCGGPTWTGSELTRVENRFLVACANRLALPNIGVTAAALETCAAALLVSPCQLPLHPFPECDFRGSLSEAAPCRDGAQCQSGTCGSATLGMTMTSCGTCAAVTPDGGTCETETTRTACPAGQVCIARYDDPYNPAFTCTSVARPGGGARCDEVGNLCQPGLACFNEACIAPLPLGERCKHDDVSGGSCAPPAACNTLEQTCMAGKAQDPCAADVECASGFACVLAPCPTGESCAAQGECAAVTWRAAGDTCDLYASRCQVGSCNVGAGGTTGTCPRVLADGTTCNPSDPSTTCDTFSDCFELTCTPHDAATCP